MILPDVNVLVYAFRREAERHDAYAEWLLDVVRGRDELALVESVIVGFVRIVTSPRIMPTPTRLSGALDFVDGLRGGRRARWLTADDTVWTHLRALGGDDDQVRGNLVPDAWIAATALAHRCRVATADRGFARFAGLDWFDPAR